MGRGRNGAGRGGRKAKRTVALNPDTQYTRYDATVAEYEFRVDGHRGKMNIGYHHRGYGFHNVEFAVNGEFSLGEGRSVPTDTGRTIVMRALQAWRHYITGVPNGTKFAIHATNTDQRPNGKEVSTQRYRLYSNLGFSEPNDMGYQFAIMKKGKIVPYTLQGDERNFGRR